MDNYGCILHGNLGTSWHVLDGYPILTQPESGFDSAEFKVIAASIDHLPPKGESVGARIGIDGAIAYVTDRKGITQVGDLVEATIEAKGLFEDKPIKVVAGSAKQQIQRNNYTLISGGTPPVYSTTTKVFIRQDPNVTILRVDTTPSALETGTNSTPPVIPVAPNVVGAGTVENNVYGWVVDDVQHDAIFDTLGTARVYSIYEKYQYMQQYVDGV